MINDVKHTHLAAKLQSKNFFHVIEELSHLIPDPASKLKFIKEAVNEHPTISSSSNNFPLLEEYVYRKTLLDKAEKIRPGSKKDAKQVTRQGIIVSLRAPLWLIYKFRHVPAYLILILFVSVMYGPLVSLLGTLDFPGNKDPFTKTIALNKMRPRKQLEVQNRLENSRSLIRETQITDDEHLKEQILTHLAGPIWLVEKKQDREIYSNGLNIITTHTIANTPRKYHRLARNSIRASFEWQQTDKIVGILYHTSESDIFPFIPEMNKTIKRYSQALIRYIKNKKSYHYFIDRFGRVYRLVQENHAAYHAGKSIWSDDEWIYLNLNHEFLGICFEGRDFEKIAVGKPEERWKSPEISPDIRPVEFSSLSEAQLRSGKELTDWLRVKYNIIQHNCVPHALASVNSSKMLIGYHLDLSRGFPFSQFGLSDKYNEPLPSMIEFGFSYDRYFEMVFDGRIWPGIRNAEALLAKRARESGMSLGAYVKSLQEKYTRFSQQQITHGKQQEKLLADMKQPKLPKPAL